MKHIAFLLISVFCLTNGFAQEGKTNNRVSERFDLETVTGDTLGDRDLKSKRLAKNKDATIDLYKIISIENDTTFVDTTLTIQKDYKFNYLRKDYFDLLPFNNIGQTFNTLSYDFSSDQLMPVFGARARHFNFMEIDDVNYYYVPTPFTELMFKTAFEQGQLLDAFFTVNTSKQFNFSIAYKGLRSLGKYQHILTSTGNFRFTTNYKTKNGRYNLRAHTVIQDLMNQENGGLVEDDLPDFEDGNPRFLDRSVFDPAFENAESILKGERFHIDQHYNIVQQRDSISHNTLSVGSIISYEDKSYQYDQTTPYSDPDSGYGDSFTSSGLQDKVTLEKLYLEANTKFSNNTLGELSFNIGYNKYNYGYNSLVSIDGTDITNRLKGNVISAGGEYKNKIGQFLIHGKLGVNISGDFKGNYLNGIARYNFNDSTSIKAKLNINSKAPNYNFLLYQSDYINYNWQNDLNNTKTKQLGFELISKKFFDAEVDYTTINDHTYFSMSDLDNLIKPNQYDGTVNYFRVKLKKELHYKNFTLDNTIRYQKVIDGEDVFNVPEVVTRNTLYYSNHFFNKALFLQTGVTFSYFTKYNMNAYDPVLAEFYVQNEKKIGGFPRLDFFINAKVRQTRIFIKAEHFNSSFTGYNFYSAPNYPYRDFVVRFGIVWNFFM